MECLVYALVKDALGYLLAFIFSSRGMGRVLIDWLFSTIKVSPSLELHHRLQASRKGGDGSHISIDRDTLFRPS